MQKFTIRDIEHMCGIKAHTFRIWEQRYNFFTPKRKKSKHRYYDNEDLKKLLRISFLYHTGIKVSHIANLSDEEINSKVENAYITSKNYEGGVIKLLDAAVQFDENFFNGVLDDLTNSLGMENAVVHVCYPFLNRVGLLWMTNNIIPAQEHFSSYLIQHKIIAETDKLPKAADQSIRIALFTPDVEHHELPLLFINYLLKKAGWRTIYLGSCFNWQQWGDVIDKEKAAYVFIYLITNFTKFDIDDYLQRICKAFPNQKIIAAGKSIIPAQRNHVNLRLLKTDEEIKSFIAKKPETKATIT
jgi:DNA-binding transcriptional MerR regulator